MCIRDRCTGWPSCGFSGVVCSLAFKAVKYLGGTCGGSSV